jgi:hypothetical protein
VVYNGRVFGTQFKKTGFKKPEDPLQTQLDETTSIILTALKKTDPLYAKDAEKKKFFLTRM